jgi:hypothetical protein
MSDNISTDTAVETETASPEASSGSENLIDTAAVESPVVTPTGSTEMPAAWYDGLSEDVTSHKGFEGVKGKIKDVDGLTMRWVLPKWVALRLQRLRVLLRNWLSGITHQVVLSRQVTTRLMACQRA